MLQLAGGLLVDRVPVWYQARCPEGHPGGGTAVLELAAGGLTIESLRAALERSCEAFDERCASCRAPIRSHLLSCYVGAYEFEDGTGTVVAWYGPTAGGRGWQFAYAAERTAMQLRESGAAAISGLGLTLYGGLKNEDCRSELGRVLSLRDRWPELVAHYHLRARTIMSELVAPGYACFVVRADCTAQVRSLARVTVPEYRPESTHVHGRLDPARLPAAVADDVRRRVAGDELDEIFLTQAGRMGRVFSFSTR